MGFGERFSELSRPRNVAIRLPPNQLFIRHAFALPHELRFLVDAESIRVGFHGASLWWRTCTLRVYLHAAALCNLASSPRKYSRSHLNDTTDTNCKVASKQRAAAHREGHVRRSAFTLRSPTSKGRCQLTGLGQVKRTASGERPLLFFAKTSSWKQGVHAYFVIGTTADQATGMTTPLSEAPRPELQRDVQRLLGRCLLRLQQYERLLKAMLTHHEQVGCVDTVEAHRAERSAKLADKSMGTLVKALLETYAVPEGFERELLPDSKVPTGQPSLAVSFRIEMGAEERDRTKAALKELVDLRNRLVHHLIEQFDVWTEEGCVAAVHHLERSYARIDQHFLELAGWAKSMDEARSMAAQFLQSEMFFDMLTHGIAPDGSFEWPHTGIVRALKNASKQLGFEGWAPLDEARAWMAKASPGETPEKYGCRTWPQVLSESGQFDLQYRTGNGTLKQAWYRERQ